MGLYSKFPIENAFDDDPVGRDVPMIRADIVVEDRRVHVVNVHIASPEGPTLTGIRLRQFQWLTDYVSSLDGPAIVAGDFNCTMWSPLYKSVARRGKLNNARAGLGIAPTWFHLGGSLYLLPLDHILARGARFTAARAGAGIGSDHRPLIAELSLPAQ
jgi:endonuclease/exonuclease/phosphatase (EEP) superfamily protein YafD